MRKAADKIIECAIRAVLPDTAVRTALENKEFAGGKIYLVAIGKAGWQMADMAARILRERPEQEAVQGIVVTKYGHVKGKIPNIECYEAGHPVPDDSSFFATQKVLDLVKNLTAEDTVIFLISGGGSALFELPLSSGEELADITRQLLNCGADIVEINTIRKRLSAVKGGRFALACSPAKVYSIVLSDILGNPLDMIASGPAYPDSSTCEEAIAIVQKYHLKVSEEVMALLQQETPKKLDNVETVTTGSVSELCQAAAVACREQGYQPFVLTDMLSCEASQAGEFLAAIAKTHQNTTSSLAFIAGGETVVHVTGSGVGGRNQELALAAAKGIAGLKSTAIFSVGSDGTDGPTDAAGGYVDGETYERLEQQGISVDKILKENDSYSALEAAGGLIKTGPTGTNVNDVAVLLIRR